jgi:hypothetical protein
MLEPRRFTQTTSLEERLAKEAVQLRKQVQGTPPCVERDLPGSQSPQSRDSSHVTEWLASGYRYQDKFN